mgnify:CR=1 FL=1
MGVISTPEGVRLGSWQYLGPRRAQLSLGGREVEMVHEVLTEGGLEKPGFDLFSVLGRLVDARNAYLTVKAGRANPVVRVATTKLAYRSGVGSQVGMTYKVFQDGQRQIIRFALPGDLIGFEGSDEAGMAYGAEALSDVTLCGVKHSVFYRACSASPQLAMNFATAAPLAVAAWYDCSQRSPCTWNRARA